MNSVDEKLDVLCSKCRPSNISMCVQPEIADFGPHTESTVMDSLK